MSENLRFQVVEEAFKKKAIEVPTPKERPSEYFGKYVFTRQKMYKYLPADVYEKLIDVIDNGAPIPQHEAGAVSTADTLHRPPQLDERPQRNGIRWHTLAPLLPVQSQWRER